MPPRGRAADNSKNYGSFLKDMADENSSVGPPRRQGTNVSDGRGIGVLSSQQMGRERSGRRIREGEGDSVSNVDAVSIGSRGLPSRSPDRGGYRDQQYTNRTNEQVTPQLGGQIYVADMAAGPFDEETRALQEELAKARERFGKLENDW